MDTEPPSSAERAQPIQHVVDVTLVFKSSVDVTVSSIATGTLCKENGAILTDVMPLTQKEVSNELEELDTQLQNQLIVVHEVVKAQILPAKSEPERPHIGLKIGFFCDIDAIDHNGAIIIRTIFSIEQNLPFITTRSMLRGSGILNQEQRVSLKSELEVALLKTCDKWEIFEQGEFLVFIPKSLESEKSGMEKLQALDFVTDGSLRQISFGELFQEPKKIKNDIHTFFSLFGENPKINKIFYIAGHGSASTVGALKAEHYKEFISFLENQRCKGLAITSCCSGGESSLLNISEEREHSFITIARSIGDFPTRHQEVEANVTLFYEELSLFLENSPQTIDGIRKMIEKIEVSNDKGPENFIQVYLPHSAKIPGGFRPIAEHGRAFSLTHTKMKRQELEGGALEIHNKEFLEIHPLTVSLKIECKERDPILLSQVPGNSHHFIQEIELAQESTDGFIKNTLQFHEKNKVKASKGFFIGTLNSSSASYEEVVIQITPKGSRYVYRENGQYFLSDGITKTEITPFQHSLFFQETEGGTRAKEAAVRASSGGQQHESLFYEAIHSSLFWVSGKNTEEIPENLSQSEKETLVFHFLKEGKISLAMELFKKWGVDLNSKDFFGNSLAFIALEQNATAFFQILLTKNIKDKSALLDKAVSLKNVEAVKLLLSFSDIELNTKNALGQTPIMQAMNNLEVFSLLVAAGASLNETMAEGCTMLGKYAFLGKKEEVKTLLAAGANPNAGSPSALVMAARSCDVELIQILLDGGAKPFEVGEDGLVPFIEIITRGTPEMLELLLAHPDCTLEIQDATGNFPAIAALASGDVKKIKALAKRGAPFPAVLTVDAQQMLKQIFERLYTLEDYTSIKEILIWNGSRSPVIDIFTSSYFLLRKPEFLEELVQEGLINPNVKSSSGNSIFFSLVQIEAKNPGKYQKLIETCIKKGVDLNEVRVAKPKLSLLETAISANNIFLVKLLLSEGADPSNALENAAMQLNENSTGEIFIWLVEQGADLNAKDLLGNTPFLTVIESGNSKLVEYCLKNGAKCTTTREKTRVMDAAQNSINPEGVLQVLSNYWKGV